MYTDESNGEVYGGNMLYGAMIVGAVFVMLTALWTPAPAPAQTAQIPQAMPVQVAQAAPVIEEVVVVAHARRPVL